uniref:Uncharacterized protein n=1 Tax=Hucho hucho TaxID=62062 RepID=A0A4W5RPK8_9TELE
MTLIYIALSTTTLVPKCLTASIGLFSFLSPSPVLISPLSCPHLTPLLSSSHPSPLLFSSHPSPLLFSSHPSPVLISPPLSQSPVPLISPISNSQFSALTIPEPKDTATAAINTQEAEANKAAVAYVEASKARIGQYEKEVGYTQAIPNHTRAHTPLHLDFPRISLHILGY